MDIRKEIGLNSIKVKVREIRLRWYGHMKRIEENNEARATVDMVVPGKRGRPRVRLVDCVRRDMPRTKHSGDQEFGRSTTVRICNGFNLYSLASTKKLRHCRTWTNISMYERKSGSHRHVHFHSASARVQNIYTTFSLHQPVVRSGW